MENLQSSKYKHFRIAQLGIIYQGLTKLITTKYKGSHHLRELHYQTCSRSPLACTMFMLEREYGIFINTINNKLPLEQTPTELAWKHALQYSMSRKNNKNMPPNISTNFTCTTSSLSPKFQTWPPNNFYLHLNSRHNWKCLELIKEALRQAHILIPPTTSYIPTTSTNTYHAH